MVTLSKRRFFAGSKRGFFPGSETDSSAGSDSDPEEFARLLVICSAFSTSACVANSTYLKCCQRNRRNKQIKREEGGEGEREGGRGERERYKIKDENVVDMHMTPNSPRVRNVPLVGRLYESDIIKKVKERKRRKKKKKDNKG